MNSYWLPELIGLSRTDAIELAKARREESLALMTEAHARASGDFASCFRQAGRWECQMGELERSTFDIVPRALTDLELQTASLLQKDGAFLMFDNSKLAAGIYQRAFDEGRLVAYDPPRPFQIEGEL